jgi:hypothetical protein
MKLCNSCSTTKSKSDFGKRTASEDGLSAKCKSCQSKYDKSRSSSPKRAEARANYKLTDEGRSAHLKANKKYRDKNPNKYKAHNIVNNAMRDGKLFKEPCEICSEVNAVHAHHDDYAKPLNVRWLCAAHHSQWHKINGEGLNVK